MGVCYDTFRAQDPDDLIEVFLMNAAQEYCAAHPETVAELESLRIRGKEAIKRMNEQSLELICELI